MGGAHPAAGRAVRRLRRAELPRGSSTTSTGLAPMPVLDFLRDIGKHFPVNRMLAREVVRNRLEEGISYTEFSYVLLQSLDYLELYRDVRLHAAVRWQRSVGQHHRRSRADPPSRGRARTRAGTPLLTKADGTQVRQDRERELSGSTRR